MYLVNARHIKNVTGRKTHILDCQWIQQLHTCGLPQASFRPAEEICALCSLARRRENLVQSCTHEFHRIQKAPQQMNVKLTAMITDITGVTGMLIVRDILVRDLATCGQRRVLCWLKTTSARKISAIDGFVMASTQRPARCVQSDFWWRTI